MPIRRVSTSGPDTLVKTISGIRTGTTKVRRITVGRPVSGAVQNLSSNIKTFDGLGDVPGIEELKLGEIGINTQDGRLYIKRAYDGIETIVEIGAGGGGDLNATTTFNAYIYTSDGTLEVITGADDAGNVLQYDPDPNTPSRIQVYLNGVLLHQGIDYVANDGASIALTHIVGEEQVVQVAAYNSTGVSLNNDLIVDDHFSLTLGTNEETRLYHNGTDTVIKHLGFNDSQFKMQYQNEDKFIMDNAGVQLIGQYKFNGEDLVTQSDINQINNRITNLEQDIQEIRDLVSQLL
ncbi:hypothetical protein YFHUAIHA_CDS0206 [Phage C48C1]|nr:hypothetical protein YFHUAIHA_CDS0206 [Phage C48C1]